jgi:hypothetical protein
MKDELGQQRRTSPPGTYVRVFSYTLRLYEARVASFHQTFAYDAGVCRCMKELEVSLSCMDRLFPTSPFAPIFAPKSLFIHLLPLNALLPLTYGSKGKGMPRG